MDGTTVARLNAAEAKKFQIIGKEEEGKIRMDRNRKAGDVLTVLEPKIVVDQMPSVIK